MSDKLQVGNIQFERVSPRELVVVKADKTPAYHARRHAIGLLKSALVLCLTHYPKDAKDAIREAVAVVK